MNYNDFTTAWLADSLVKELGACCHPIDTCNIKNALVNIGHKLGLTVYPDSPAEGEARKPNREFLWDVSWWKEDRDHSELILAAESEWGDAGEVCYDLDKLPVAKAPWKLLITDAGHNGLSVGSLRNRIERQIKRHADHRTSETYVWIDHEGSTEGGMLHISEFKPQNDGRSDTPFFREVNGSPFRFKFER